MRALDVLLATLIGLACFGAGLLVGRGGPTFDGPERAPQSSDAVKPVAAVAPPAIGRASVGENQDLSRELAECRARVAAAASVLEQQSREKYGVPAPFPEDIPSYYRDEELYGAAVEEALASCGIDGLELRHVDCTEFPCIAWMLSDGTTSMALKGCDVWLEKFPKRGIGSASGSFMVGDSGSRYESIAETPLGHETDENAQKRFVLRVEQGRAELMEVVGGREPTERESWEMSVDFWRKAAERDPGATTMLEMILAKEPPKDGPE